ncbi:acyl-CoA synthetase [Acidiferrimicrobium sp. IK]|uniref:acyl-CoA synthetase n=1 Tax=Acidiferrimicrobium sp. IK TaxID=2871700 RepID=UPI0021CB8A32|nr:acyl-CoA synthetase [Acidiferrimicrobium sp. IK]MCU4184215.1 acyl-CoA synthetase [Acidiferrimicrobium sp. IK]
MEANLADIFELAVDTFPDREYLVTEHGRRTYREMDRRANRLAHFLADNGIGPGDHVGIYAYNCLEWVETLWAVFKLRAVWVNVNYRYVAGELRHIFSNADLDALVYARRFGPRVAEVTDVLGDVGLIRIEDGSGIEDPVTPTADYEAALAAGSDARGFPARSGDDHYILYTGGTTGLPKGVVWRHEDVFYALGGGLNPMTNVRYSSPAELVQEAAEQGPVTFFPLAPLMHGASQWGVMGQAFKGNRVVLLDHFDATDIWRMVERERVNVLFITGDAMARPLIEALDVPGADHDTSSLVAVTSTAALFSQSVKDQFFDRFPTIVVTDSIGSSEGGAQGVSYASAGQRMSGGPTVTSLTGTLVIDEHFRPVPPGSGVIGMVARTGHIPLCYYNDPVKSAATFPVVDGVRYAIPGDYARVEADGTVTMLGRGSVSINSGGEKIFPEEVETALKSHLGVWDATVIGVPDERWGERVAAIVQLRPGHAATLPELQDHLRGHLAGYKLPRQLHLVEEIVRSPSGKPDYTWAKKVATTGPATEVSAPALKD